MPHVQPLHIACEGANDIRHDFVSRVSPRASHFFASNHVRTPKSIACQHLRRESSTGGAVVAASFHVRRHFVCASRSSLSRWRPRHPWGSSRPRSPPLLQLPSLAQRPRPPPVCDPQLPQRRGLPCPEAGQRRGPGRQPCRPTGHPQRHLRQDPHRHPERLQGGAGCLPAAAPSPSSTPTATRTPSATSASTAPSGACPPARPPTAACASSTRPAERPSPASTSAGPGAGPRPRRRIRDLPELQDRARPGQQSASLTDLGSAVNTAAQQAGVAAISNSYGGGDSRRQLVRRGLQPPRHRRDSVHRRQRLPGRQLPGVLALRHGHRRHLAGQGLQHARGWSESAWSGAGSGCTTLQRRTGRVRPRR